MCSHTAFRGLTGPIAVIALLLAAPGMTAFADIIHVYEGESIQAAIDSADNGDEIVVHPGTYNEPINFIGKAITVRSADPTDPTVVAMTIISGGGSGTVVTCNAYEGPNTVLSGLTITGGGSSGMRIDESSPTIANCTFIANNAYAGGGISNSSGSPTVTHCTFVGNSAADEGGGVYIWSPFGSSTVTNCIFVGNTATIGGGVYCLWDSLTITNCTLTENSAVEGGAMYFFWSSPTVTNCILWDNSGGEIFNDSGYPVVTYCVVEGGYPGNSGANPLFLDPANGDYRLFSVSPCIDAGNSNAVPPGVTADLDGNPRFVDDPDTPDTGVGFPCVDIGAYEFQVAAPCPADINGDATVDVLDLLAVLSAWGATSGPEDINGDGVVDVQDLLELLSAWGPCA